MAIIEYETARVVRLTRSYLLDQRKAIVLFFPPLLLVNLVDFTSFLLRPFEFISNSAVQASDIIFLASVDNFFQSVSITSCRAWVRTSAVCDHWDKWGGDSNCEGLSVPPALQPPCPRGWLSPDVLHL